MSNIRQPVFDECIFNDFEFGLRYLNHRAQLFREQRRKRIIAKA